MTTLWIVLTIQTLVIVGLIRASLRASNRLWAHEQTCIVCGHKRSYHGPSGCNTSMLNKPCERHCPGFSGLNIFS